MSIVKYNFQLRSYRFPLICDFQDIEFLQEQEQKLNDLFHDITLQYNFELKREDVLLLMLLKLKQEQNEILFHDSKKNTEMICECRYHELEKEIYLNLHLNLKDVLF